MTAEEQARARLTDAMLDQAAEASHAAWMTAHGPRDEKSQAWCAGWRDAILDALRPVFNALEQERDDLRATLTQAEAKTP